MKNLSVDQLKAREIVVESGNGLHTLTITGTADTVGMWLENDKTGGVVSIVSTDNRLEIGIYGRTPEQPEAVLMDIGIAFANSTPVIVMLRPDGSPLTLTHEVLASLLEK